MPACPKCGRSDRVHEVAVTTYGVEFCCDNEGCAVEIRRSFRFAVSMTPTGEFSAPEAPVQ